MSAKLPQKTLGGYVRGTIGFQKKLMPTLIPRPGGWDNGFYAKDGGKHDFLTTKRTPVKCSLSKNDKMA